MKLTELVKNHAKALGCDSVGVCSIEALREWKEEGKRILPNAHSVVVVGCRLSRQL